MVALLLLLGGPLDEVRRYFLLTDQTNRCVRPALLQRTPEAHLEQIYGRARVHPSLMCVGVGEDLAAVKESIGHQGAYPKPVGQEFACCACFVHKATLLQIFEDRS